MAKTVLTLCSITVNAVDLSDHVSSVEIDTSSDDVDLTGFQSALKVHGKGLGDGSMKLNFFQDFAAGSVNAVLWPIAQSQSPTTIIVKPTSAAVSTTNPKYTMQGLLMNYSPLSGKVGDASQTAVTFQNGDPSGIVQAFA